MELWERNFIPYFNGDLSGGGIPQITPFIIDGAKTCILICPGGAYSKVCIDHEGYQVAQYLNSIGVSSYVLEYRVFPHKHPVPITDAKRAIRYIRHLAREYGYKNVGVMGFSAGGHLAASTGVFDCEFGYENQDNIDKESSKPDFMVLCYPVLSFLKHAHRGSFENLSEDLSQEAAYSLSIDKHVSENTPPTFLFHTSGDDEVPVENSLLMANALSKYNVNFEIHTFMHGGHGVGLSSGDNVTDIVKKHTSLWTKNLENWLKSMGYLG